MAGRTLFTLSSICITCAFFCAFVAFASPYWIKSWTRVHSPMANVGLWHVCLSGYIKPRDPTMHAYVGCWWIHSTIFNDASYNIMPHWFRAVQAFAIFTLLCDLGSLLLILLYLSPYTTESVYKDRKMKLFILNCVLNGISAALVFMDSLIFAQMSIDPNWMPRPWMNYLSFSYGLNVLSGFFSAFACMFLFLMIDVIKTYPEKQPSKDDKLGFN
ncbi:uncharacterized protein LOC106869630 [Octopus bimaculoides]|uniref:Uncharacterized protein n=1 Tax=Octopus bimaculoides TaxID=37653 RepID=A0A0L8HN95_OCTBM|nr:uncharacterized protein LOC106869630 [Octopus bimaculoides]UVH70850.1 CLAUDIN-Like [Octopus bimaculoides]|eukprot:XP_014770930.1 PREDICTED: uncharacterized protein LOC106869630 [Octopus bimaculoides]